jgi:hypothetical protein
LKFDGQVISLEFVMLAGSRVQQVQVFVLPGWLSQALVLTQEFDPLQSQEP